MLKQLYFPGLELRLPRDKLFFSILSPVNSAIEISKAADDLRNLYGLNGRLVAQEQLHVSLHAIGLFDGACQILSSRGLMKPTGWFRRRHSHSYSIAS